MYKKLKEWEIRVNRHRIKKVLGGTIAEELGVEAGDVLLEINETQLEDIFDYQFMMQNEEIEILIEKANGEQWLLEIEKEEDEDLGIEFENGLMDEYRSCHNKCIFCFIDQMPKGMRETLYFKDDDTRLSFLQGNYVTLTNLSDKDIERIIQYNLGPINISFQTMNADLRCKMLNNRFAGEALKKVDRLYQAGIQMNGQIVLCKGINDKEELEYSISEMSKYLPYLASVSVVPVGISKYREGLYPLEPFTKEDAREVISCIEKWQMKLWKQWNTHFVHGSDEWYILANLPMPKEESYDGYIQLENGVGMLRLFMDEFEEAIEQTKVVVEKEEWITIATGMLAYPYIKEIGEKIETKFPKIKIDTYGIVNEFFGENITVSGLLTGQDIVSQLKDKKLGNRLLLPENVLRYNEDVFLDDMTVVEMEKTLQVTVDIVKSSGYDILKKCLN